jgi:hypothetical protein
MRFTIRDLMWATALVATGAAWWVDHRACHALIAEERIRLLEEVANGLASEPVVIPAKKPPVKPLPSNAKPN